MVNDPIADMLTRIRNASMVQRQQVVIQAPRLSWKLLRFCRKKVSLKASM